MSLGTSPEDLSYSIFLDRIRQQPPIQGSESNLDHVRQQRGSTWVPDSASKYCHLCKKSFNLWRRIHHCRLDGWSYCHHCCSNFIQLPKNLENIPECPPEFRANARWDFRVLWNSIGGKNALRSTKERVCDTCYMRYLQMKQFEVYILIFGYLDLKSLLQVTQVSKEWHRAANVCKSIFRDIQYILPGYTISPIQRRLFWNSSPYLAGHSRWILKFLTYLDWSNLHDVALAEHILRSPRQCKCWSLMCTRSCQPQLSGYDWIQLVYRRIPSPVIQSRMKEALLTLSDEDIQSFLPQLTFSLKYNNFLLEVLLAKAISNHHLRTAIYWNLVMLKSRDTSYHLMYNLFMTRLHDSLGRQIVFGELIAGRRFIKFLAKMPPKEYARIDYLRLNEENIPCKLRWKPDDSMIRGISAIPLPLNPDLTLVALDVFGIKAKDSITSPLVIPLRCEREGHMVLQEILYKPECLIQDSIIISIIQLMDRILQRDLKIDFGIRTYRVLPLNGTSGIIEMVANSETLYSIKYQKNFTLLNYLLEHNQDLPIAELRDRFIKSAAAYCVISYLLGVGDRHLDNIMITRDGYLFHIDYGYILGHDPKPLTPAMRITQDIVDVMGGESGKDFQTFRHYCTAIYNCLRKYTAIFMSMLLLMTEDGLNLDFNKYRKDRLKEEILSRFVPSETAQEAEAQLLIRIDDSYRSYTPRMFIDFWHYHSKETLSRIFS
jgi:phosphatidylinositol 3-kinase